MLIARVTSHLVATAKTPHYRDFKILRLAPLSWKGELTGDAAPVVALDLVDAGVGDTVLVCQEGRWARETLGNLDAPVRSMVVAIVERISTTPEIPSAPSA